MALVDPCRKLLLLSTIATRPPLSMDLFHLTTMPLQAVVEALFRVSSHKHSILLKFKFDQQIIKSFDKAKLQELAARYPDFKNRPLDRVVFQASQTEATVVYDHLIYPDLRWDGVKLTEGGSLKVRCLSFMPLAPN
jgi:hypothetical protein